MILSGLIFLPLAAVPTLALLRKTFQVKLFYALVTFVHLVFSLGLLTKHGYLFEGVILGEQVGLFKNLGLNYSVSLSAAAVLMVVALDFIYLIFGSLTIKSNGGAILLSASHTLILMALMSTNILLSMLSLFIFSFLNLSSDFKEGRSNLFQAKILTLGMASFLGVCLIFCILYESVYGSSNLNIYALIEMRTPFVKGSLYSTQFVLFIFYYVGVTCFSFTNLCVAFKRGLKLEAIRPFIGFLSSLYMGHVFSSGLFPEASKFYLPSVQNQKAGLLILLFILIFSLFVNKSVKLFLERPEHV